VQVSSTVACKAEACKAATCSGIFRHEQRCRYSVISVTAVAECRLEYWHDLSLDLMGLGIRNEPFQIQTQPKEIMVRVCCVALQHVPCHQNADNVVRDNMFSCQVTY
jgi:hypothetical protein